MTPDDATPASAPSPRPRRRLARVAAALAVGALAGWGAVYGIGAVTRNAGDPLCRPAVDLARRLAPLVRGEVAALTPAATGLRVPNLRFQDSSGEAKTLEDWRGRTVLLNLWATWCVPCRKEMPALDALQAKLGGAGFEVVAINIDTRDPDKPKAWLREAGIAALGYFSDEKARVFQDLKMAGRALGMPTTLLIDPKGCEIGTLAGPAEWASEDAVRLIEAALRG